jgi:hypothetical protein
VKLSLLQRVIGGAHVKELVSKYACFNVCTALCVQIRAVSTDVLCSGIKTAGPAQVRPDRVSDAAEPQLRTRTGTSTAIASRVAAWTRLLRICSHSFAPPIL